jgi:hypothetical protein
MTEQPEDVRADRNVKIYLMKLCDPPRVFVKVGHAVEPLASVDRLGEVLFTWGDSKAGSAHLAEAILLDALDGDDIAATKLRLRFMHRTVSTWREDQPQSISWGEVMAHVAEIKLFEQQTAQTRAMVAREPPPVVMEGGSGIGKSLQDWEKQRS